MSGCALCCWAMKGRILTALGVLAFAGLFALWVWVKGEDR